MSNLPEDDLRPGDEILPLGFRAALMAALGAATLTGVALYFAAAFGFGSAFLGVSLLLYLAYATAVIRRIGLSHPHRGFGLANTVTLARLALTSLQGGFAAQVILEGPPSARLCWIFFAFAVLALALDGLDGAIARSQNMTSAFGARFDMEVDALMILVLSVTAYALHKAGIWVLAIGAMRYVYVGASYVWYALTRPVPPSRARKVIAAIQGCVLAALLMPPLMPPATWIAAGVALVLLTYSFGIDIVTLTRRR